VAEDRRELALLLAGARVRLAPGDPAVLRGALELLDRSEAAEGPELEPSRAAGLDRARYLELLGDRAAAEAARRRAEQTPARSARDHYLLATAFARRGGPDGYARAVAELNEALRLNPRHFWSLVQRGVCRLELGQLPAAAGDFGQCAGLRPDLAWGFFNRGYVLDRDGQKEGAVADYTVALERDPAFAPARLNRGLALLELRRYGPALDDFGRVLALPGHGGDAAAHAGRAIALEGLGRHAEALAAFAEALRRAEPEPTPARARVLWSFGFAVAERDPAAARRAFDDALHDDPRQPQALYGRGMLDAREGREGQALGWFDRAVAADPAFDQARRSRALVLARLGDWARAGRDINRCLDRDPNSGETLYVAACVAALAAGKLDDPKATGQALQLLRQALDRGVGRDRLAGDPDLENLRALPEFRRMTGGG
jgi:tetratricopeptide (TPR) repeat protein